MEYTSYTNMKKPGYNDPVDIYDINDNFDVVDVHIGASLASDEGVHGLRYKQDILEVYDAVSGIWEAAVGDEKIDSDKVGAANGVAPLDAARKVPIANLPQEALSPAVTVFAAGTTAPTDTKALWIDTTASTGGLKYHNGTAWVHVPVAYT